MMRVFFWKESREQWLQIVALTLLGILMVTVAIPMMDFGYSANVFTFTSAMLFAWACGMVTGSILLSNEMETATQTLLDTLPSWRRQIWWNKLAFGVAVTVPQILLLAIACLVMTIRGAGNSSETAYLEIAYCGFLGLGCGMAGSAFGRNVLAAVGFSFVVVAVNSVLHFVLYALLVGIGDYALSLRDGTEGLALDYAARAVIFITTLALPFLVSGWIYTRVDAQRRESMRFLGRIKRRALRAGWGLKSTIWMSWKQGWAMYAALAAAMLVIGPMLLVDPVMIWPLASLLIGILAGVTTFADEQRLGSFRFLAEQRLPLGRLWFWKVITRMLLTAALSLALVLVFVASFSLLGEVAQNMANRVASFESPNRGLADTTLIENMGISMMFVWVIYGFCFGLLFGMLARKTFLALAFALPLAVFALVAWIPTLFAGGLSVWQLYVVPLGVLILARWTVWPWATERLVTWRYVGRLGTVFLLAIIWTAGCLIYRVTEVPAANAPFNVAAFRAEYRTLETSEAPSLIRQAETQREQHVRRLLETGALPPEFRLVTNQIEGRPFISFEQRLNEVDTIGWRVAEPTFAKQLDLIATGEWIESLEKAATLPLGVIQTPIADFPAPRTGQLSRLLTARALQLQAQGDDAAALHLFSVQLALARHVMSRASTPTYSQALSIEKIALVGLEHWAADPKVAPDLLERAMKELQLHERSRPPVADAVKVDYLILLDGLASAARNSRGNQNNQSRLKDALLVTPMIAPWEKARRMRLVNGKTRLELNADQADFPTMLARTRNRAGSRFDSTNEISLFDLSLVETEADNRTRDHLFQMMRSDPSIRSNAFNFGIWPTTATLNLCRIRAAQIRMALLLFQHRNGRPAEDLAELVPNILPGLPADPFTNGSFLYRLSGEEWIEWRRSMTVVDGNDEWVVRDYERPEAGGAIDPGGVPAAVAEPPAKYHSAQRDETSTHRHVPAGYGILWSCGVDGIDHGGKRQTLHESMGPSLNSSSNEGFDMIFVIPKIVKK